MSLNPLSYKVVAHTLENTSKSLILSGLAGVSHNVKHITAVVSMSLLLTACGNSEHHEVHVEDVIDEAAQIARENAPKPVDYDFKTTDATAMETTDAASTVAEVTGDTGADNATELSNDELESDTAPLLIEPASSANDAGTEEDTNAVNDGDTEMASSTATATDAK